jgi:hypothetical protein
MQVNFITDDLLADHLKCHTKAFQRFQGKSGDIHDYVALCSRLDARYHASASQWLASQSTTGGVRCLGGLRLHDIATSEAIILDAVGVSDELD